MTYWNPVLRMGVDEFSRRLAEAGGAGLITPDLIPDEAAEWFAASDKYGLDRVFLVAPSSTPERLARTVEASRGFVYAVSIMGVTGARASVSSSAQRLVADTRRAGAERVCVGLGVSRRRACPRDRRLCRRRHRRHRPGRGNRATAACRRWRNWPRNCSSGLLPAGQGR